MTLLFLARISTVPSGIGVKVMRSPGFKRRLSRMARSEDLGACHKPREVPVWLYWAEDRQSGYRETDR
jgi:hypothetical protein